MRVISQDGNLDFPYEKIAIQKVGRVIYSLSTVLQGSETDYDFELAEYSTEEKALKAMEMLRDVYAGVFVTNANVSDDFESQMKEVMQHGFGAVLIADRCDSRVEFNNLNGYFKFPKDDEVEV